MVACASPQQKNHAREFRNEGAPSVIRMQGANFRLRDKQRRAAYIPSVRIGYAICLQSAQRHPP